MKSTQRFSDIEKQQLVGKFFIGVVRVITTLGRVRVYVPGLFDGVDDQDLPMFSLIRTVFRGVVDTAGWYSVPRIGTRVLCVFDQGDIDAGIILGELADALGGPNTRLVDGRWGFIDEAGTQIDVVVNETLTIHHKGATVIIQNNGGIDIHSPEDINIIADGNMKLVATRIDWNPDT